ncbi:MAG: hypothetical protein KJ621_17820 [Proteobacteria bacterium]|nr:hypothetical protein [Pseudomonadota bacterium]
MANRLKMNTRQSMLLMMLAVAVVFGAFMVFKFTAKFQKPEIKPAVFNQPQDALARVIGYMFTDISRLDEKTRRLFWKALEKAPPKKRLQYIGFLWAYNSLLKKYQLAFLDDAAASLKSGKARLSKTRADVEVKLIELYRGVDPRRVPLVARVIEYNRQVMANISAKKPVELPGGKRVVFTLALIERLKALRPQANQRREAILKNFLTPPPSN